MIGASAGLPEGDAGGVWPRIFASSNLQVMKDFDALDALTASHAFPWEGAAHHAPVIDLRMEK